MGLQADLRAAAVELLTDYKASAGIKMTIYSARPSLIAPPHAFVETIRESIEYPGMELRQRTPVVEIIVVHGVFDSMEAANQKDAFFDGFLDWVTARIHAVGANTTIAVKEMEDIPNWVPDWLPEAKRLVYYATRISMEGYAEN